MLFLKKKTEERAFKIYITDALKAIAENTARQAGGRTMTKRYVDIITPPKPEDDEAPEEKSQKIVDRIRSKLNGGQTDG